MSLTAISDYLHPMPGDGEQTHLAFDDVTLLVNCLSGLLKKIKGDAFGTVYHLNTTCIQWQTSKKWLEQPPSKPRGANAVRMRLEAARVT